MKKNKLILVLAVFVFLYIGPMVFASSYGYATIPTEPNMTKDFALSTEYSAHEQSITSFSETIPDDILYYPDGDLVSETILASAGSSTGEHPVGSYVSTQAVGGAVYSNDDYSTPWITAVYLNFTIPSVSASTITVSLYSVYNYQTTTADTNEIGVWDGASWVDFGNIAFDHFPPYDETWVNFTIGAEYIISDTISIRGYLVNDDNIFIYVDYAEVYITSPIVLSSGTYAESFTDVSDWTYVSGLTFTSDGDLGIKPHNGDTAYDYEWADTPNITGGCYIETRFRINVSGSSGYRIRVYDGDGMTGTTTRVMSTGAYTTWTTSKVYCAQDVESVRIGFAMNSVSQLEIDYLRISPSDEMGWQHDFSTTEGISSSDGGTIASDGDTITLTADGDGSTFLIVADTTATASAISTAYYPMFGIEIDSWSGSWILDQWDGSAYATILNSGDMVHATEYFNIASLDSYVYWWRFTLTATSVFGGEWIKAYSIANYTYSDGGSNTVNDYFYVDNDKLVVVNDEISVMRLNHDPALSVPIGTYNLWHASLLSGDDNFRFRELLDTSTIWDQGITEGELVGTTLTDFDILFYGDCVLISISFLAPIPQWNTIVTVQLWFNTPLDVTGFNMLLIFFGVCMIPASTIFLVYGGRKNFSMDKMFYFLIAFIIGWALLIGGIM